VHAGIAILSDRSCRTTLGEQHLPKQVAGDRQYVSLPWFFPRSLSLGAVDISDEVCDSI
jgi:hypothetical protein